MMIDVRNAPKDVVSNAEFYEKQVVEVKRKKEKESQKKLCFDLCFIIDY
jgi:hypothetical protein